MSKIHHLFGEAPPRPTSRVRGSYRKKVTVAEIERAIRTAEKLGLTIYGVTIEGTKVHVQTKPGPEAAPATTSAVDEWFARHD